eukprot:11371533-Alexandrium_andersonii.AAC.1
MHTVLKWGFGKDLFKGYIPKLQSLRSTFEGFLDTGDYGLAQDVFADAGVDVHMHTLTHDELASTGRVRGGVSGSRRVIAKGERANGKEGARARAGYARLGRP